MLSNQEMEYHPTSEKLVDILCAKALNNERLLFRIMVGYYFSMAASMMRCSIATHDTGDIPVNLYALNLSPSGTGKGKSTGIIENQVMHLFRQRFIDETFPLLAEQNLAKLAVKRAHRSGEDPDAELERVNKEFKSIGSFMFSFSEATSPAIKQMRHKLLMAEAGSLNLEIDEIGSYLTGNMEAFNNYLELYDTGRIKQKLTKSGSDSVRHEEIHGQTPANLLMFGTPSKLLDGGKTEEELYSMLETGYARRCLFGYLRQSKKNLELTPEQIYDLTANANGDQYLENLSQRFENLADMVNVGRKLTMSKDTALLLIEYRLKCEKEAATYRDHEEVRKAEMSHRYFKALKLAGAYAFMDDSLELTQTHLYHAIKLVEESGEAFNRLLNRDKPHVKLAKYIADMGEEVTQSDIADALPFYKGSASQKQDMMNLAIAWGYRNNVIIKKSFADSIEFFRGETLQVTDLSKMVLSYSHDMTENYLNEHAPFEQLHKLVQAPDMHWVSHHLVNGYRNEENCIPGFNLVVLDVDGGTQLSTAKALLAKYKWLMYTTKRSTDENNRFRIILPLNYTLQMDSKEYKEFMANICEWLPFETDQDAYQRGRKWLTHPGHFEYNDGELLDALPFIPKTAKNEERKRQLVDMKSMDNLERWFIGNIGDGNRNNLLLRFAKILVDQGLDYDTIHDRVKGLNNKLVDKLDEAEIQMTILKTVAKDLAKRVEHA